MNAKNVALGYARRGWPVFPVEARGKEPIGRLVPHGLKDATTDEARIQAWWTDSPDANIGGPTGIAFDVADLDSELAMQRFQKDCKAHGTDPRRFPRARTGGGGRHILVEPTGEGNRARLLPDMDWRGRGGYVVLPGSVHASGEPYEWITEPNGSLPPCPDWLLELLRPAAPPPPSGPRSTDPPPESYVNAAVEAEMRELRDAPVGQRNDQLNRSAFALGQMVGAGWLSQGRAEAELRAAAHSIEHGKEPGLTATLRSGLTSGMKEPRQAPAEGFNAAGRGGEIRTSKAAAKVPASNEIYSMADLEGLEIPEPRAIVPGVIHAGLNMLVGKGKLGKSWLALSTSIAVAIGGKALGSLPVEKGEVLYLALEDNKRRMQDRALQLLGKARFPGGMYVAHTWPKLDEGGGEALEAWLSEHPKASLVIIDVWKRVRPKRVRGASLYDEDYEHLVPLQALALRFDIGLLVVHHTRKASAEDVFDEISGSGGVLAALDSCIVLHRSRSEADGEIWITGRDVEEAHLALNFEDGKWSLLGSAGEVAKSKQRESVRATIVKANAALTPGEIAQALGWPNGRVRQLVFQMLTAGELRRLPNSKYALIPPSISPNTPNVPNRPNALTREGEALGVRGVRGVRPTPKADARPRAREGCPACGTPAYSEAALGHRRCHRCGEVYPWPPEEEVSP